MKADKDKLYLAMARACMNAADVRKAADMPTPTFNNVIAGRSVMPATLGKVAKALNVDVKDLLED
ncbi:MAG: hypothetical protein EOM28_08315 [Clostridia bacterium]|nr:hypothetical protein [Clostridia bacterium]